MEAQFQSSNSGRQRLATTIGTRLHGYTQSHPKAIAIGAVIAIAVVFVIPFAAQALTQDELSNSNNMKQESPSSQQLAPGTGSPTLPQTDKQSQQSIEAQTESNSTATNDSQTNVTVNGEKVDVPENGNYSKTIQEGTSRTDINVQSNHTSTTNGSSAKNNSSVDININSESHSSSSD